MLRLALATNRGKRTILSFLRNLKPQKKRFVPMDTTEYLMSSPENRDRLLKAIDDVKNGRNIIYRDLIEP
ncbi:hypothetical protein [Dyadobacter pollutisoli]|jgi:Flp pilus assembly CpaF family ATPase|uniref:Uncharacterized protein n=1 Tax=Dyadobacter pollutisoli TaxID=2910158 RepID=A0A9E8N4B1_9BACT|nr:hypothetical protein [Dyadobacter pollutisoli]WAC09505.1 hypothetical protein ON006_17280 [Dyadobacter pollutisoli]